MIGWVSLLLNVGIGSAIGGVTNELAIRMLFRPYKPWMIGKFRVPFTPGLIPRRHDELAIQMGKMVEEHLLTREGVKKSIAQGNLQQTLEDWLIANVEKYIGEKRTIRDLLVLHFPESLTDEGTWSELIRDPLYLQWDQWTSKWVHQIEDKHVRDLLPKEGLEKLDDLIDEFGKRITTRFREFLHSAEGQKQIQEMLRGVLSGGVGMFGGLVGMFLGDDKIINKILPYLDEMLANPELSKKLSLFIRQEADKMLDKPVKEMMYWLGEGQIEKWKIGIFHKLENESLRLIDKPLSELLGTFKEIIIEKWIPRSSSWLITTLENNVDRLFDKLSIREIVARQVETFPLERVEEMIIGISGKEFRMITVLGFILGGMIGLVQGIVNILF